MTCIRASPIMVFMEAGMNERKGRTRAFLDGCRMAVLGHLGTWLGLESAKQVWHLAGHVVVGMALYILEKLLHP